MMIGGAVIIGEIVAVGYRLTILQATLGFAVGFTLLASAMAANDYYDAEIDSINNPNRPIPSGALKRSEVAATAILLALIGLALAAATGTFGLFIACLSVALSYLYNTRMKPTGLPGNAIVSTNVALPFIFGGFVTGNMTTLLWVFALLSFLASVGREVIKGIVDLTGDMAKGMRTIAVRYGEAFAARLGVLFFLAAVTLSLVPAILSLTSVLYVPFVLMSDLGFSYSSLRILRSPSALVARRVKREALIWMSLGLLAFLAGNRNT